MQGGGRESIYKQRLKGQAIFRLSFLISSLTEPQATTEEECRTSLKDCYVE